MDKCRHCGEDIAQDCDNGWVHDEYGNVGCGAPFGEHDQRDADPQR